VGLPAPTPLALFVALGTLLPYVGVVIGAVPSLLLAAGFLSLPRALLVVAVVLALEVVQINVVQPRITREVMYVGPALIGGAMLVGYEIYGLAGALFGYALVVMITALTDAISTEPVYAPSGALADS
jgi:predicted PurR-regulated permease PerM